MIKGSFYNFHFRESIMYKPYKDKKLRYFIVKCTLVQTLQTHETSKDLKGFIKFRQNVILQNKRI